MNADYIKVIVDKIDDLPYKAILFDGTWGIGKSYAVNQALEHRDNVCKISMFGLNDAKKIYHEVLFQLALKNNIGSKLSKIVNDILERMSSISKKASQVKDIIYSITQERELFTLLSKEFKSPHIIVIDDLERASAQVSLEEVLGIVEELKHCNYVKVILIAHLDEIKDNNKELLDKYSEKVIDRIYHITESPNNVDWGKLNIHAGFITEFLSEHKVKNLRTLEKAQRFYDDVNTYCSDIDNEDFKNEIRLICFSIVVESIDNLYYRKDGESEKDSINNSYVKIGNELEYRIKNYLAGIKSSSNLVSMLLQYYKNEIVLDKDIIIAEYKGFLQAGCKPNYYKTDEEIRRLLPDLLAKMDEAQNLIELNKFADAYMVWSDIIKEDNAGALQKYRIRLQKILENVINNGKEEILSYSYDMFHLSSEKVKQVYIEEKTNMRKFLVKKYIEYLQETTKGNQAYEYSCKLCKYFNNTDYKDIIKKSIDGLLDKKSFPVDDLDEKKYHTCYNIMYILFHTDSDKFLEFCGELGNSCDCMAVYRIDYLTKELIRGY